MEQTKKDIAIFGNGCFWCTEAIFQNLQGVSKVEPGYIGGHVKNPTYEQVCKGTTGHAEALRIYFDPAIISYNDLLEVFFATHDPTTLNRQGADVGTQYRSEIFFTNNAQKEAAAYFINQLNLQNAFGKPVVTQLSEATEFWIAEDYHHNYFNNNPNQPYCRGVIAPKLEKFKEMFIDELK